jgi:Zn-dependent oligopeptidase
MLTKHHRALQLPSQSVDPVKRWSIHLPVKPRPARPSQNFRSSASPYTEPDAVISQALDRVLNAKRAEDHAAATDALLKELSQALATAEHSSKYHQDAAARKSGLQQFVGLRQLEMELCNSDALRLGLQSLLPAGSTQGHLARSLWISLVLGGTRSSDSFAVGWDEQQKEQYLQQQREDERSSLSQLQELWNSSEFAAEMQVGQQDVECDPVIAAAVQAQQGSLAIQLDLDTCQRLLADHPSTACRQQVYDMGLQAKLPKTAMLLAGLVQARTRIAQYYGLPCYAELAQQGSLAGGAGNSIAFLEQLAAAIKPHADAELARLQQQHQPEGSSDAAADWEYLHQHNQQLRWKELTAGSNPGASGPSSSHDELQPYLQLDACLQGISTLLELLLGIKLVQQEVSAGEGWTEGLRKYSVQSAAGQQHMGTLFIDTSAGYGTQMLHFGSLGAQQDASQAGSSPASSSQQDAHAQQQGDACAEQPVVAVGLLSGGQLAGRNLSLGLWELLHELGHAMHFILSAQHCHHLHFHGCRCPLELLEVPSHIFERFAMHPASLRIICRHQATGDLLPEHLAAALAEHMRYHWYSPVQYQQQVMSVLLDQLLHAASSKVTGRDVSELWQAVWARFTAAPALLVSCQQAKALHKVASDGSRAYGYMHAWYLATAFWVNHIEPLMPAMAEHAACSGTAARDDVSGGLMCAELHELLVDGASMPPAQLVHKHWPQLVVQGGPGAGGAATAAAAPAVPPCLPVDAGIVLQGLSVTVT